MTGAGGGGRSVPAVNDEELAAAAAAAAEATDDDEELEGASEEDYSVGYTVPESILGTEDMPGVTSG